MNHQMLILNLKSIILLPLAFDDKCDLALDDLLLPLRSMFEKLQLTMKCQSSSIRRNQFFLWALKRPFELISSLASPLFPQTVSDPMRLQFEKRIHQFQTLLIFPEPLPLRSGCLQSPVRVVALIPEGKEAGLSQTQILLVDFSGSLQDKALSCAPLPQPVSRGCALSSPCAWSFLKLPWDSECVPRKRAYEDRALFRFLFSPKGLWYRSFSALVLLRLVGQVFILSHTCKNQAFFLNKKNTIV